MCTLTFRAPKRMNPLQEPRTNDGRSQGDESLVNSRRAIGSQAEFPKAVQPGCRTLDDPAIDSQSASMFYTALGDSRTDAAPSQFLAMKFRMIGTITVQFIRPFARMPDFAAHVGNGVNHVEQFLNIVNVGTRDGHGQR